MTDDLDNCSLQELVEIVKRLEEKYREDRNTRRGQQNDHPEENGHDA